jgi:lauroyl/myristoyl acyltransferase
MASKKKAAKSDTTGVESFEEAARVIAETSSMSRFSEIKKAPSTGELDGTSYVEERGEPKKGVKAPDEE